MEISVCSCPIEKMWGDVLTKPLQGQKFSEMQAVLIEHLAKDSQGDSPTEVSGVISLPKSTSMKTPTGPMPLSLGCVSRDTMTRRLPLQPSKRGYLTNYQMASFRFWPKCPPVANNGPQDIESGDSGQQAMPCLSKFLKKSFDLFPPKNADYYIFFLLSSHLFDALF